MASAGFARNLLDGTVEVIAEAADDVLAHLEDRLREGPSFAAVSALDRLAVAAPRGPGLPSSDRGQHERRRERGVAHRP